MRPPAIIALSAVVAALAFACHGPSAGPTGVVSGPPAGVAACAGTAVMTRSPVALSALQEITPLGNLNPTGHVFPSDHLYLIAPPSAAAPATLVAPANIVVANVGRQSRSGGGQAAGVDYIMQFFPCADVMLYFYHMATVTPEILAQVGSFDVGCSPSYVTGGVTYQQCYKTVSIAVPAGTPLGTMVNGVDLGGYDRRIPTLAYVDAARTVGGDGVFGANHAICPLDYFVNSVADSMRALLGGRGQRRTVSPLCGQVMQDVAGTAQGRWFFGSEQHDDPHLALVHDNVDATLGAFSVGSSIATLAAGVYTFTPLPSGRMNADFSRVTADGAVYCYQSAHWAKHILLRMTDIATLQIGAAAPGSCGDASTWTMTGISTQFAR